jgi:hypothetical protein
MYWKTNDNYFITPTRKYIMKVYRWRTLIYQSKEIVWTHNGLNQAINEIDLVFPDHPHGLSFVIAVYSLIKGRSVKTEVKINPLLNFSLKKVKQKHLSSSLVKLEVSPKSVLLPVVNSYYRRSESTFIKKNTRAPRQRNLLNSKAARPNPEQRRTNYTEVTSTTGNPSGTTVSNSYLSYYRSYVSVRTPNFKARQRAGTLPVNAYSMLRQTVDAGPFTRHEVLPPPPTNSGNYSHFVGSMSSFVSVADVNPSHLTIDENLLISKLGARINAADVNIPEDLFQAKQTLSLFTNNSNRLRASIMFLRRGNLGKATASIGTSPSKAAVKTFSSLRRNGVTGSRLLAEMWLELRYGWIPLINDIDGSIKSFSKFITQKNGEVATAKASVHKVAEGTTPINNALLVNTKEVGKRYYFVSTSERMSITYKLDDRVVNLFASLGFTSPTALVWELIPFSFVVDWFLPIGNALQAYHTFDGLSFLRGYKTYFTRQTCTASISYSGDDLPYTTANVSGVGFATGLKVDRVVLTDFPKPNFPRLKNPVSLIHAANAAALLTVAFTGKH